MEKIPTLFTRDWQGDRSRVTSEWRAACCWVLDGEGVATQKLDGTCCLVRAGALYKRHTVRAGKTPPLGFESVAYDDETRQYVGWLLVGTGPEDRWHREAFVRLDDPQDGTYELVGPHVQGNPERYVTDTLVAHHQPALVLPATTPRDFAELRLYLDGRDLEGIVWHHPDGRMAKIKTRDFGLRRREEPPHAR